MHGQARQECAAPSTLTETVCLLVSHHLRQDGLGNYVIGVDSVAAIILRVFEHGLRSAADESAVELAHRPWASAVWAYDARA